MARSMRTLAGETAIVVSFPENYPADAPDVELDNVEGISDERLEVLREFISQTVSPF